MKWIVLAVCALATAATGYVRFAPGHKGSTIFDLLFLGAGAGTAAVVIVIIEAHLQKDAQDGAGP
jgi:hypothetical protein